MWRRVRRIPSFPRAQPVSRRLYSTAQNEGNGGNGRSGNGNVVRSAALFAAGAAAAAGYLTLTKGKPEPVDPQLSTTTADRLTGPKYASIEAQEQAFGEIEKIVGKDNVTRAKSTLDDHSDTFWNTHHAKPEERPGVVVFPSSTEQVSEIMKVAHKYGVPVTPFSGGTSLEGHFTPSYGGVCLDFARMDQVLQLNQSDLDIVVQPGMGWEALNDYLEPYGLFFAPDPGPGAEIGGMIGTSCSGTNAGRYGTMRENVVNLTVVLADGTVVKTRRRPRKSSAGYNLTGLFVGSEGTLGVVTEATLKLNPIPANEAVGVVTFSSVRQAADTVAEIVQHGLTVGAVELLDDNQMDIVNKAGIAERKYDVAPTLFFKFIGTDVAVKDQIAHCQEVAKRHGSLTFEFARDESERTSLWSARKNALWSTIEVAPKGYNAWTTDVAVPVSHLPDVVAETKADIEGSGLVGSIVGHVLDGNFHAFIMYSPEQRETVEAVVERMIKRAISADGTVTGEHGIGAGKIKYLEEELGTTAIDTMRQLKLALDPKQILNPGKVIVMDPKHHYH
ncbi:D-lactate dehydrogenase [cytochrome] 1, mitochondrial [Trichomonascus vanleenenianus]|uniref:D-lactate dehydrogenase [cytochrome] 1, mitochondrial n=1 Tax=Trichomonascus vanleenenianus TaxID=2268995 RepID=UPI003ECB4591